MLVGFSEKLRLMSILIDDIRPIKEFMIRGCREVRRGGKEEGGREGGRKRERERERERG